MRIPLLLPVLFLVFQGTGSLYSRPVQDQAPQEGRPAGPDQGAESPAQPVRADQGVPGIYPPRFAVIPENPRPGEPVTIGFIPADGAGGFRVSLFDNQGKRLSGASCFEASPDNHRRLMAAILAVPSTAAPGPARIQLEGDGGLIAEIPLVIGGRDFVSEEIVLDEANTSLRTLPDPRKTAESERLWAILSRTGTDIYAGGAFTAPVASTRRTSFFGDRRVYRYVDGSADASIHAGIDFGVPRGTAVTACAAGKVVLARPRIVTGNSVVLEHLPGVYSIYYHLDKIRVSEGTLVSAGTILGESGSTGLATGPHLHWEIRVSGENADPDAFISRPILDKEAILSKIGG
jgi:murein DD-endopeptidase MepM/ murein hydrolase activator NlpD